MNVLLVDIGNSRIKVRAAGIDGERCDAGQDWLGATRVVDVPARIDECFDGVREAIDTIVVSNVASAARGEAVDEAAARRWPAARIERVVPERERCGVVNGYAVPGTLGADRWMALLATRSLLPDRSALVCSFGTATTLDLLVASPGARSTFVGGLILPGFDAMRRALSTSTARLPLVAGEMRDFADRTADAMTSGVLAAQAGAVERALRQARDRQDGILPTSSIQCVVTGGNAETVAGALASSGIAVVVRPDLVLHGMRLWACDAITATGDEPLGVGHG